MSERIMRPDGLLRGHLRALDFDSQPGLSLFRDGRFRFRVFWEGKSRSTKKQILIPYQFNNRSLLKSWPDGNMMQYKRRRKESMIPRYRKFLVAVHIMLFRGDTTLLLRRYKTGYEDGNYSVVAGHLNGGESVKQAAIREAKEEIGADIRARDLRLIGVIHRLSDAERVELFLSTKKWSGKIVIKEPDKCDDLSWFHLNKLPSNTIPYIKRALQRRSNHLWFEEIGWD